MQQGGGSGLGLWLTRSIIDLHGGSIGATSEGISGKGSIFYIDLPLHSVAEDVMGESDVDPVSARHSFSSRLRTPKIHTASLMLVLACDHFHVICGVPVEQLLLRVKLAQSFGVV